jgi:hypothetical protein
MSAQTKTLILAALITLVIVYFSNRGKIPLVNAGVALPLAKTA